jgi:hypothetical protein
MLPALPSDAALGTDTGAQPDSAAYGADAARRVSVSPEPLCGALGTQRL